LKHHVRRHATSFEPVQDTPGQPGLTFDQLGQLLSRLIGTGRVVGLDVTIYDPELDPAGEYAPQIVACLTTALTALSSVTAGKADR
jgi:arginase